MASAIGELLVRLSADVSGLRQGSQQAVQSLGAIDDATQKTVREASRTREVLNKMIGGTVIVSQAMRVGAALQQLGGTTAGVGKAVQGFGEVLQGALVAGPAGAAAAVFGVAIQGITAYMMQAQQEAAAFAAAAQQAFDASANAAHQAQDALAGVLQQLSAIRLAQLDGISVTEEANQLEQHTIEAQIAALERKQKALRAVTEQAYATAIAHPTDAKLRAKAEAASSDEDASRQDMAGLVARLTASKAQGEIIARQQTDSSQMQRLGLSLESVKQLASETGDFGGALKRLGGLQEQLGDRTDDAAKAFVLSLVQAKDVITDAARVARSQAALVGAKFRQEQYLQGLNLAGVRQFERGAGGPITGDSASAKVLAAFAGITTQQLMRLPDAVYRALEQDLKRGSLSDVTRSNLPDEQRRAAFLREYDAQQQVATELQKRHNAAIAEAIPEVKEYSDDVAGAFQKIMDAGATFSAGTIAINGQLTTGSANMADAIEGFIAKLTGPLGDAALRTVKGFQSNGIEGALPGIVEMMSQSKQGKAVVSLLTGTLQIFADMLGQILVPIGPLLIVLRPIAAAFSTVAKVLEPIISVLSGPLFYGLKYLGLGIAYVSKGIAEVYNGILDSIANLLDWIHQGWGDSVRKMETSIASIDQQIADLNNMTFDSTMTAFNNMANAANSVSDALYNLPPAFKVEQDYYDALDATTNGIDKAPAPRDRSAGSDGGTSVEIHGDVNVQANNPDEFVDTFTRARQRVARMRGTTVGTGYTYSTPLYTISGT